MSIVYNGQLLGKPLKERMGVWEGTVESPHQFNAYIEPLKQHLEAKHPKLCKLYDTIITVLMYADDAALQQTASKTSFTPHASWKNSAMTIACPLLYQKASLQYSITRPT